MGWSPAVGSLPLSLQTHSQRDAHPYHVGSGRHRELPAVDVEDEVGKAADGLTADLRRAQQVSSHSSWDQMP